MSTRRQARELVLGCLYACEVAEQEPDTVFAAQAARQSYDSETRAYAQRICAKACEHAERIDAIISERSEHWELSRIGVVEKNILRAATAELWYCPETPVAVIINEAVELAKEYAGDGAGRFVNGILDWVSKHGDGVKRGEASS